MPPAWEDFVADHFPGYILPASAAHALPVEAAARFLERLTGRPNQLELLRGVSTVASRTDELRRFALVELPSLVRVLPSLTTVTPHEWEGGFQGRLDLRRTMALHLAGHRTRFVTSARQRSFDRPENVLVCVVAARLLTLAVDLRQAGLVSTVGAKDGWAGTLQDCEGALRQQLTRTVLREVAAEPLEARHFQAAHSAVHPCYALALSWFGALRAGLDSDDPEVIAQVVARGALAPLAPETRFELAVVIRLIQALAEAAPRWTLALRLIEANRCEVAELTGDDGAAIRVHYNHSSLPSGPVEKAAGHYLGQVGRMRPDVTIELERRDGSKAYIVVEVKCTDDATYRLRGFHEAVVYRHEYAEHLTVWPKAILTTSSPVGGSVRTDDDVIAVGWDRWVPGEVAKAIVLAASSSSSAAAVG